MMDEQLTPIAILRKKHFIIFGFSVVLAIASLGVSVWSAKSLLAEQSLGGFSDKAQAICLMTLREQGFSPKLHAEVINVSVSSVEQLEAEIGKASIALSACPTYELVTFCAGGGCENKGMEFSLAGKK